MAENLLWIPGEITWIDPIRSGELTTIEITLPRSYRIRDEICQVVDEMTPGSAFKAKPFGMRSRTWKERWYSRSNYFGNNRVLQTIINRKKEGLADTSWWWQTTADGYADAPAKGKTILIGMQTVFIPSPCGDNEKVLMPYEPPIKSPEQCVKLEKPPSCFSLKYLDLAFYTGLTAFLGSIRFLATANLGFECTLIVSVRDPSLLMFHKELCELERRFPNSFRYIPVATREWDATWQGQTERIIQRRGDGSISLAPLLELVPDLEEYHLRLCGGKEPRDELLLGLKQAGIKPRSFRAEVW